MRTFSYRVFLLPLALLLAPLAAPARGEGRKDLAELDGSWKLVTMEANGRSLMKEGEDVTVLIKDGKATSSAKAAPKPAKGFDLSRVLDPTRKPKRITYRYEGALTFYGIYEVKGDELRVCGDGVDPRDEKNPESRRPRKFDSNMGLLLVFKRLKK